MDIFTLLSFILVATTLVISPGPDSILILRNTIAGGRRAGYMTLTGVQVGIVVHALLAVAGLSAVLYSSPTLFRLLAVAGAVYLAWIGYLMLRHANAVFSSSSARYDHSDRHALRQGALCNLLNPKVLVLFIALMPGFVNVNAGSPTLQLLFMSGILLLINIPFQCLLVVAARQVSIYLRQPGALRTIQYGLGIILIVFALKLFIDHAL